MDESRQVDKRQMDSAERMNSPEGAGKTASSPPFKRARLKKPLDGEQEKTGKDETELISLEDALVMKSRWSPSSSAGSSILDKCQPDREISFHQVPEGNVPLYREAERVGEEPRVIQLVDNLREVEEPLLFATSSREVEEPLFFETPSPGPSEESRRDRVINMVPIRSLVY